MPGLGVDRFIISRTSKSGRRTFSTVYTPSQYMDWSFASLLIGFVLILGVIPIVAAFGLLLYPFGRNERIQVHIISLLTSGYLLLDIHKEWWLSSLIDFIANAKEMVMIFHLNVATLTAHVVLLFFDELFFTLAAESELLLLVYVAIMTWVFYLISQFLF